MSGDTYVIWSYEHGAWWRPASCGYTTRLEEAGHYSKVEADRIVADANIVSLNECALTLNEAQHIELELRWLIERMLPSLVETLIRELAERREITPPQT